MTTREEVATYCHTLPFVQEEYPFDANWLALRHTENKRVFAFVFDHQGGVWCNVKATPVAAEFWRSVYPSIVPAYHMNKTHWISIILDGSVPDEDVQKLITESYDLTAPKRRNKEET